MQIWLSGYTKENEATKWDRHFQMQTLFCLLHFSLHHFSLHLYMYRKKGYLIAPGTTNLYNRGVLISWLIISFHIDILHSLLQSISLIIFLENPLLNGWTYAWENSLKSLFSLNLPVLLFKSLTSSFPPIKLLHYDIQYITGRVQHLINSVLADLGVLFDDGLP